MNSTTQSAHHESNIHILLTNRDGGFSQAPYHSMNLGTHVNDHLPHVLSNRQALANRYGLRVEQFVYMNQVHGNSVAVIEKADGTIPQCDAMVTQTPGVVLMVLVADCVPIVLSDPSRQVVAVAHAGWRGTVSKITANVLNVMNDMYGCQSQDIQITIGPAIGRCCYQVGHEVIESVHQNCPEVISALIPQGDATHFDLHGANRQILIENGINPNQIHQHQQCVCCHSEQWFSYRASGGRTGRFGMGVWIQ
ncbi:MAG: peptidoglycan editing factor PgeF [Marinilabiliaceae bacterium]|nr:peptidoglycan editing factor PgeF [Marinilabiliaceae bacterium]